MRDCYKKLIDNLCNRATTWSGANAKYIDACSDSQFVKATVKQYIMGDANSDMILRGTVYPYSNDFCTPLPLLGKYGVRGTWAEPIIK